MLSISDGLCAPRLLTPVKYGFRIRSGVFGGGLAAEAQVFREAPSLH